MAAQASDLSQLYIICKLAEVALCLIIYIIKLWWSKCSSPHWY